MFSPLLMTTVQTLSEPYWTLGIAALSVMRPLVFGATLPLLVFGLPWALRLPVGAAIALPLWSGMPAHPPAGPALFVALTAEAGVGLALALAAGFGVWAAQGAGRAIAVAGLPHAGVSGGALSAPISNVLGLGAAAVLLTAGAHRPLLRLLARSRSALPVGEAGDAWAMAVAADTVVDAGAGLVEAMAALAIPAFAATGLVLAVVVVMRRGAQRAGPRLAAGLLHAPLSALAVLATLAGAASVGLLDDAFIRSWGAGRHLAQALVDAWSAGP